MDIIKGFFEKIRKRFFPKYKTKKELRKTIRSLEMCNMSQTMIKVEREVIAIKSSIVIDEKGTPVEILKQQLRRQLTEHLEPCIEYDIQDSTQTRDKIMTAKVYVTLKK